MDRTSREARRPRAVRVARTPTAAYMRYHSMPRSIGGPCSPEPVRHGHPAQSQRLLLPVVDEHGDGGEGEASHRDGRHGRGRLSGQQRARTCRPA